MPNFQKTILKHFILFFSISILIFDCKNSDSFEAIQEKNGSDQFALYIRSLHKLKKVDSNWWGDNFYLLELSIHNLTDRYIILNFFSGSQDDLGLKYSLSRKEEIYEAFKANPASFDISYFTTFQELKLVFKIDSESPILESEFGNLKVFRSFSNKNDNLYLAPFVGSYFGVPLKKDNDIEINASSGWIQPKSFNKIKLVFSLPAQAIPVRLIYGEEYSSELRQVK